MRIADFDYQLPPELIAQSPAVKREQSRLMVAERKTQRISHLRFSDLAEILRGEDLLVLNDTRVFPARMFARREGAALPIEVLLLRPVAESVWEVLVKPGKKTRPGARLFFGPGLEGVVLEARDPRTMTRQIRFNYSGDFWERVEALGMVPLPPYINRLPGETRAQDRERYQTVFAKVRGSVAAPTAGLHFTHELLQRFRHVTLTLHVGYGTFQPVRATEVENHRMHEEFYQVNPETAAEIQRQKETGQRVVAVGTTSTRVLEYVFGKKGKIEASQGWCDLFIYPGFRFRVADALITNFHLPRSTLLLLVSAFGGRDFIRRCYEEAVREKYRFYSYGDAMLIV